MEKEKCEAEDEKNTCTCLWMLPEGCIAKIFALTTPRDVSRLSVVSPFLRSIADSDSVWAKFLPSDYLSIIARSSTPIPEFRSLKELYVYLSHNHIVIDEGRKIFSLEKWTGKKCYFLGARDLTIVWSDTPDNWEWISLPESRFPEVAELKVVWWLEIWSTIRAEILSPLTSYAVYFVYKLEDHCCGLNVRIMEVSVRISGVESENMYIACLHPDPQDLAGYIYDSALDEPLPKLRDDGWFELQLGEIFTENEDDCIELRVQEVKIGHYKRGLIVEGIEIRPKIA